METLLSFAGIAGALCCVGMYAAVSIGRISAERPTFFVINGIGSILILIGCIQEFDMGDAGSISQELIWALISIAGLVRVWLKSGGAARLDALRSQIAPAFAPTKAAADRSAAA